MKTVFKFVLAAAIAAMSLVPAAPASALERVAQYGVGSPSGGAGGIGIAADVAVAPDGTVVVSDQNQHRVDVFAAGTQFLRAFGRDVVEGGGTGAEVCANNCKVGSEGSGAGELRSPSGIAVSSDRIYVAEQANNRISVFGFGGNFLFAFGANVGGLGVNVCTSVCAQGTAMPASGALASPSGLSLDESAGLLYVSDGANARVDVFRAADGGFVRAFGKNVGGPGVNSCTATCGMGTGDGTPGSVTGPFGNALGPEGNFFSGEAFGRVSVFTKDGALIRTIGSPGTAAGNITSAFGVAVTPSGVVYVADLGSSRVESFLTGGDFVNAMGLDVIPGGPNVAEVCTLASGCKAGNTGFGIGEFTSPFAAATDCRGAVYIGEIYRVDKFIEPGTAMPPCPPPSVPAKPSNQFKFGKAKGNRKKGTLTVTVEVPGAGALAAGAGKKISAKTPQPTAAGIVTITVAATGKGVKALRKAGKLKGTLSVTFTPSGGDPATQTLAIELKKQKKGKGKAGKGHKGKGAPGA